MASSSSSLSLPPAMEGKEYRNWADLPPELTLSILRRLGGDEILENAQKVCTSWRRVCKDPSTWRKIVMRNIHGESRSIVDFEKMCRHAVYRSQGGLVEIELWYLATDSLLSYITSPIVPSNLRSLKLSACYFITNEGLIDALVKLPLLEDLEVSCCPFSAESMKVVGKSCLNLKTFKLYRGPYSYRECDDDALAIAETMPGLRHLDLFGNRLSNTGLNAILDNCPYLEHLDLRQCFNVNLVGDLEKRCSKMIKVVRRPND